MVAHGERSAPTGQELLAEFVQYGHQRPFEEIVRRYAGMVFNVCVRITKDKHEAEDATQAVFLTLALQAKRGTEIKALGPWLQQVAKRLSLDSRRSKKRRKTREERHQEEQTLRRESILGDTLPEADLDELKTVLHEELQKLPTKYRLPLILHYFGGLSRDEMAAELGCKASTLGVRIFRGREMLAGRLSGRGINISAGALAVALGFTVQRAISDALISSTSYAASALAAGHDGAGLASAHVIGLTRRASSALAIGKVKIAALTLMIAGTSLGASVKAMDMIPAIDVRQMISNQVQRIVRPLFAPFNVPIRADAGTSASNNKVALARPTLVDLSSYVTPDTRPNNPSVAVAKPTAISIPASSSMTTLTAISQTASNFRMPWIDTGASRSDDSGTLLTPASDDHDAGETSKAADVADASTAGAAGGAGGGGNGGPGDASGSHHSDSSSSEHAAAASLPVPVAIASSNDLVVPAPLNRAKTSKTATGTTSTDTTTASANGTNSSAAGATSSTDSSGTTASTTTTASTGATSNVVTTSGNGTGGSAGATSTTASAGTTGSTTTGSTTTGSTTTGSTTAGSTTAGSSGTNSTATSNPGQVVQIPTSNSGSVTDGNGVLRGSGNIPRTGTIDMDGMVVADGNGVDRTLTLNFTAISKDITNAAAGGSNGWYAVNHGRLSMPLLAGSSPTTLTWGDSPALTTLDLVNSVRLSLKGTTSDPLPASLALLSPDRDDLPNLAGVTGVPIGLWEVTPSSGSISSAEISVRYNDTLIDQLGANESQVDLWTLCDATDSWSPVNPSTLELDTTNHIVSGYGSDFSYFAVTVPPASSVSSQDAGYMVAHPQAQFSVVPEPVSLIWLAVGGAMLSRRRRRS